MAKTPKPPEIRDSIDLSAPEKEWMDTKTEFKEGMYCYAVKTDWLKPIDFPNGHVWAPNEEDWHLP